MAALQHGATEADIQKLMDAVKPIIRNLMGRDALYEWTRLQLIQACLKRQTPMDYTSFVRGRIKAGLIRIDMDASKHTKEFLATCDAGAPHPPAGYFIKLGMGCATC